MTSYHQPVLLEEVIDGLAIRPNGIYVDATFGGGGHAAAILERLNEDGRLYGFDQDEDAAENVLKDERFTFVGQNFRHLKRFLRLYQVRMIDGLLADLGVSSHQLDVPDRGFSFRFDASLDMRMNQAEQTDAAAILNSFSAEELQRVFSTYGEVRNAKTLARSIVEAREVLPIKTIHEFLGLIDPLVRGQRTRYLAQVFQALRIEVNDELKALEAMHHDTMDLLKPNGRIAVISYHSLEDRMIKHFFKTGNCTGDVKKDFYGNIFRPFRLITKKAIVPDALEIEQNPRARSAKLRIAERVKDSEE